jgi:ATP-binding cassette, subfamily B, bacterial
MTEPAPEVANTGPLRLYRAYWRYAVGDRRRVVLFMAMLIVAQIIRLAIPYLSGKAVDAMQSTGDAGLATAAWDMALIFIACVVCWIFHGPARVMERAAAARIRERFADTLYRKVTTLPLDWHERHHSGDTIERVQKAGSGLFGFAQAQFVYLQNAVSLIGPIAAIFVLSVPTGIAALTSYVVMGVVLVRFDDRMIRLSRAQNAAQARYVAALVDCLGNVATVLTLRLQEPTRRLIAQRLAAIMDPFRGSIVLNEIKWAVIDLLNSGVRCGLAVLYGWLAWRQGETILLGSAVMVYQYAQQAGGVVSNMAGNYQELVGFHVDLGSIDGIAAAAARAPDTVTPPSTWREIHIGGLNFTYPNKKRGRATLVDVTLDLRRGERIALVGESGSGKSTLLRVLAGLYQAEHANFTIDGHYRRDLTHLGAITTLAPQDPEIFAGTIGHNLTLGIDHDPADIRSACDLAVFTPVVETLPAGLATNIAERGFNLSGGQKQRLALARAILAARGSSLMLLDEPTSSLDPATEARVYANLLSAMPDACFVSSVHRLHLLEHFDRVVLIENGRILDSGAAADLLERAPRFRELWQRYAKASPMKHQKTLDTTIVAITAIPIK